MKSKNIRKSLSLSRGDFLLSKKLFPHPDEILVPEIFLKNNKIQRGKEKIYIGILDNYLKFLELIVTNQRIIDLDFSIYTETEANRVGKKALEFYFDRGIRLKEPIIEQKITKELEQENIYFPVIVEDDEFSPRTYVDQYLDISPQLQKLFDETIKTTPVEFKKNDKLISRIALAEDFGIPLSIIEMAKFTSLPYSLHGLELKAVKQIETAEINLRQGVIASLMDKLNAGAKKELENLSELGNKIIYPETPIAWQIIRDSTRLEDFLPVALQLREEYKAFREATIKIEDELFSDEITLKRKGKLIKELNSMAAEIWKGQGNTTQKIAQDFSSLLDLALGQATNLSIGNFPKLLDFILGKPTELLLSKLRQRRIKVLMNSKKQFMSSSKWINKLSSIFSLPEIKIKESILKFRKLKKE